MCSGVPGRCDFEVKMCDDWHQERDDTFDWAVISGETDTRGTGPSGDHTTRSSYG